MFALYSVYIGFQLQYLTEIILRVILMAKTEL
jgi:hypothetical protein